MFSRSSRLLTLSLALCLPSLASAEMHKWTSTSGTSLDAEMVTVDIPARAIKLKSKEGKELTIPIDSLTEEDKTYAAKRWKVLQALSSDLSSEPFPMSAPAPAPAPATAPAPAMPAAKAPPADPAPKPAATPPAPATTPPPTPGTPPAPTTPAAPAAPPAPPPAPVVKAKPAPPRPQITITPLSKFKAPAPAEYVRVLQKTRPRILQSAAGWAALKAQIANDTTLAALQANLKKSAEQILEAPELTRIFGEQKGPNTPGSKAMYRIATIGALNFTDSDPRWKDRGVRELIAITDPSVFQNWYVNEPEVTTDFLVAATLGYDWFRDGLNAQQATAIRMYMVEKGIGALVAHLKGEPPPPSAIGKAAAAKDAPKKTVDPKAKAAAKKEAADKEPDADQVDMAAALLLAGICLYDEEPAAAKQAIETGAKVFGRGMIRFAPGGIWPEGMAAGEKVLDYAVMVLQTLRANTGADLGFSTLEGIPQAGLALVHLVGPTGQLFNYGDTDITTLTRPWVGTWLAGVHGNMGSKALNAGAVTGPDTPLFSHAGNFIYYNAHAAGEGTAESPDYAITGNSVTALRSAWGDPKAYYIAVKGGDNSIPTAQLDLGSFVLDAGGQRWAIELGAENDRVPGFKPADDRTARYKIYREDTRGQNTLYVGGNQSLEAKGMVVAGFSSPAMGVGIVDFTKAYSKAAKEIHRGALMMRGPTPYILLQDDINLKNNGTIKWSMHTRATITLAGNKATLTMPDKSMLTAVIVSPSSATFGTEDPVEPDAKDLVSKKYTGIHVLKINLSDIKGPQMISVAFALGDKAPAVTPKPVTEWVPKR